MKRREPSREEPIPMLYPAQELRIFRAKSSYMGIADIGAESLGFHALVTGFLVGIASADIEMNNGVVHSLSYTYQFSEL